MNDCKTEYNPPIYTRSPIILTYLSLLSTPFLTPKVHHGDFLDPRTFIGPPIFPNSNRQAVKIQICNMGNKNQNVPHARGTGDCQLQALYQIQLGKVTQQKFSAAEYIIRDLSFSNSAQLNKTLVSISDLQLNPHPTLISLLYIEQSVSTNMCGSLFKLRLVFEHSSFSMYDQIEVRKKFPIPDYFDFADCCRVIIGCIRALSRVEEQVENLGELINAGVYHRVFVNPQRLLIMQNGVVKVMSPLLVSPYDRYHHKHCCYYSPEKLRDFDYPEDGKSCVFELGLTFLHIFTLEPCQNIYNGFEVKQDQIDIRISRIWQIYRHTLICEILFKMTRIFRSSRVDIKQCLHYAGLLEIALAHAGTTLTQNKFSCQFISPSYGQDGSKSDQSFKDFEAKKYQVSHTHNEQEKQNISHLSNKEKSSLQKPHSGSNADLIPEKPGNKSSTLSLKAKSSCIITNEAPFHLAMIASGSGSFRGKESYCYGNELNEGLIAGEGSKFEWKRTKFNKKKEMGKNLKSKGNMEE